MYKLLPNQLSSKLNDHTAILNYQAGTYYGLNEVGTCVWERLQQAPATFETLRAEVLARFDVDEPTCTNDLNQLLADLIHEKLVDSVKQFKKLSRADQMLLVKTGGILLAVRIALVALPLWRVHQGYLRLIQVDQNRADRAVCSEVLSKQVWAIRVVSGVLRASCLPQALALKYFLRFDQSARLMIGVSHSAGFKAHAWVQKQNQILIGDLPQFDYQPLWQWDGK